MHLHRALLGGPFLITLIVDICDAEARLIALSPLEVIHQRPSHVPLDITPVLGHGLRHGVNVIPEVVDAELVLENLLHRQVVLALDARPVLRHVDRRVPIPLAEPVDQVAESLRVRPQPEGLCLWTDDVARLVAGVRRQVPEEVLRRRLPGLMLDVVGRVMVHAVEVIGPFDERGFLWGELRQTLPELLAHGIRVLPEIDGVGEP
ncbi:hypothetical protein RRF57_007782 [Xylaria bambusicola]|uniref:Secreted protein n=1 Tax=Xylaria bambusicola TaxID=326684 RepID=A0AAN7ULP1_9PEZI